MTWRRRFYLAISPHINSMLLFLFCCHASLSTAAGSFSGYTFHSGLTLPHSVYFGPCIYPFITLPLSSAFLLSLRHPAAIISRSLSTIPISLLSPKLAVGQGYACMVCVSDGRPDEVLGLDHPTGSLWATSIEAHQLILCQIYHSLKIYHNKNNPKEKSTRINLNFGSSHRVSCNQYLTRRHPANLDGFSRPFKF
jgi:hypothetical protein